MFWPMAVYFAAVILLVGAILGASYLLGERHRDRATDEPYESGIVPTGTARLRISAKFYLTAMFFVIFDVASVFVFAWAIAFRKAGWPGYAGLLVFIATMVIGLLYLSQEGALDWGPRSTTGSEKRD